MKKLSKTPVCLFVYNKDHLIDKILDSLLNCNNFENHKVYIFSDSFVNLEDKKKVETVRLKLKKFKKNKRNIRLIFRKKNFGLKRNIILGVNKIINKYKKIIVIEDDLILSSDFLDYIEKNLIFYKNCKKVFSITGFSPNINSEDKKRYNFDNFFSHTPSSWGWATWHDRWNLFKPIYKIKKTELKKIKKIFDLSTYENYFSFLDINLNNRDLWAANWSYASLKNKSLNSYPLISKVSNIGFDGTGQGGISKKYKKTLLPSRLNKFKLNNNIELNIKFNQILNNYYKQNYLLRFLKFHIPNSLKQKLKKFLYKIKKNFNYDN